MGYVIESFRTLTKKSKPYYDSWSDEQGTAWASLKLPPAAADDLRRSIAMHPAACLPQGWTMQIDPTTNHPFFVLAHPKSHQVVLQQWQHPAIEGIAVGYHYHSKKAARWSCALAACELLFSVGRLADASGQSGRENKGFSSRDARRGKKVPHMASPQELKRLAEEGGEWYIMTKATATKKRVASIKGLRASLNTCFLSYRWGKFQNKVTIESTNPDKSKKRHLKGRGGHCVCRVVLPDSVLDEMPEITPDQRCIVGEGPTRDLAESAALLLSCRALARLGLLVQDGAGTLGQDGNASNDLNPFVIPFPHSHTKGFKSTCKSAHVLPPAPLVTINDQTKERMDKAVTNFKLWMPLPERNELFPTQMPKLMEMKRVVVKEGGNEEKSVKEVGGGVVVGATVVGKVVEETKEAIETGETGERDLDGAAESKEHVTTLTPDVENADDLEILMKELEGITPIGLSAMISRQPSSGSEDEEGEGEEEEEREEEEEEKEEKLLPVKLTQRR